MKTKKTILVLCLSVLGLLAQAQNGLEKIFVERYYVADAIDAANSHPVIPVGAVTYRIYADMLPGYKIQTIYAEESVFGGPAHPMTMTTTTYFWNQEDYGASIPTFSANNTKKNTVMLDSWLSTGGACNGFNGILKSEDNGLSNFVNSNVPQLLQNNAAQAGIPLTTQDGMLAGTVPSTGTLGIDQAMLDLFGDGSSNGNTFLVTDGAWYCLSGATGPIPVTNKVLIAQITTDGIFHFELNMQIGTPSGGTQKYVHSNPTGVELTIPSLIQTFLPIPVPPTVSISAPANNSSFALGTPISIAADANDGVGNIIQVEFFVDGISIGIDALAPYTANYTGSTVASHVLTAKAIDNDGQITTSAPVNFNVEAANKTLNLTLFLEGLYDNGTGTMHPSMNASVPQWGATIADKITIGFHSATNYSNLVFTVSDVNLNTNGTVSISVPTTYSDSYYITIVHRNSIETVSTNPVSFAGNTINYSFDNASKAYGGNLRQKGDGTWVIYSGDTNQDGIIDAADMIQIDNDAANFVSGYVINNINGDGLIDITDMMLVTNNASTFVAKITP